VALGRVKQVLSEDDSRRGKGNNHYRGGGVVGLAGALGISSPP